jgi:hypothetical protein
LALARRPVFFVFAEKLHSYLCLIDFGYRHN